MKKNFLKSEEELRKLNLEMVYNLIYKNYNIKDNFYQKEIVGAKWTKTEYGYDWRLFGYNPYGLSDKLTYFCNILSEYGILLPLGYKKKGYLFKFIKKVPKKEIKRLNSFVIKYKFHSGRLKIIHQRENPEDIMILDEKVKKLEEEIKVVNHYLKLKYKKTKKK